MVRIFWSVFLLALLLSSCVPNKRIVYLQHSTEPKLDAVTNKDSLSRTYSTRFKEYLLRPRDVISLHIGTITPNEFDFVQKYMEDLGIVRELNQYDQASPNNNNNSMRMNGMTGMAGGDQATLGGPSLSPILLDRLQTGFTIDEEGILDLPKVGKLNLAGLSIPQAEKLVREKLYGFYEAPLVRIQLLSFHFTILGEVNKEGRYTIFNPNATVFDAISIAENLTDFADRSKIKVVRFKGDQASVTYVNALKENLLEQPGFYLQPNDLIIVPPLEARATRKYTLPNYTTGISLVVSTITLLVLIATLNK
jgi:polysaccharide biosynthesis/export protein